MEGSASHPATRGRVAVRTLTKNVALHWATEWHSSELDPPRLHPTPILEQTRDTPIWDGMTALTPMGTLGHPEDIAVSGWPTWPATTRPL